MTPFPIHWLREDDLDKIIIEARVNELATRNGNPHVPFLPHEIIADAKATYDEGASVFHYHGRTSEGDPYHEPEFYLETNAGIKSLCDILIHPTLGYVAKSNVTRPRALIATPQPTPKKEDTEEKKQRANLWKARVYCDQAYQSYQKVIDIWRLAPPGPVPVETGPEVRLR